MANLLITTQILENYGAHAWDGQGVCPQQWKAKGGNDYVVKGVELDEDYEWFDSMVEQVFAGVQSQVEQYDMFYQEYMLSMQVVDDAFLAEYDASLAEYEMEQGMRPSSLIEVSAETVVA